jgi:hypothetical protein
MDDCLIALTILTMIGASLFKPDLKIKKLSINTYWIVLLRELLFLLAAGLIAFPEVLAV